MPPPDRYPPRPSTPRKRMMAQGRKGHFLYDLREILQRTSIDAAHWRAFGETLFAKGSRGSTEQAVLWLRVKVDEKVLTEDEGRAVAALVDRYSFWR